MNSHRLKWAFESATHFIPKRNDVSVARDQSAPRSASGAAPVDQGDVTVTDVFVDHGITFDAQGINSFRSYSAAKARYTNRFDVLNGVMGTPAAILPTRRTLHGVLGSHPDSHRS
jgi:hypothetical protein